MNKDKVFAILSISLGLALLGLAITPTPIGRRIALIVVGIACLFGGISIWRKL